VLLAACQSTASPTPAATAKPAATTAAQATTAAPKPAATQAAPAAAKIDYPTKPITILVPFNAGGSSDVGARIIAPLLEKDLGQSIVIVNKPGAGGQLGWTDVATAKPDGYTIGAINLPHLPAVVVDPERKAVFKQEDIVPFISQALDPTVVSVLAESPWKTLKDLVDDAKKRPDVLRAGVVGILNDDEIGYLQLAEAAGISMRKVYYDGAAPAMAALLGGQVDVLFSTIGDNFVNYKAGKVRVLANMDKQRNTKFMPDVPTTAEAGYPQVISASTRGFAVPKGTPKEVVDKLTAAFKKAMESQDHMSKMEASGQPVLLISGAEFQKYYDASYAEAAKWVKVLRAQ
jgi:tripartite-type tricarboxylate transporter receptor subunit TctC